MDPSAGGYSGYSWRFVCLLPATIALATMQFCSRRQQ